jgi:hypothetical protein
MAAFDNTSEEAHAEDTEAPQITVADGEELWVRVQEWATQVTC